MTKTNNKKIMLLLVAVFVLPILLAKVALEMDFFNKGATNKGNLLSSPIELSEVLKRDEPIWRLVYTIPENCDKACENSLYSVNQVWQAVGKEQDRVEATVLYTSKSDPEALEKVTELTHFLSLPVADEMLQERFKDAPLSDIYIADTLGNVILSYSITNEQEQAVMRSRDVLSDLKKLLKLSRIG